ncbi:MAG: protein-glutamine glutaminase family protein [Burkholderiales bacterium]|nr:protein-glutamine glutaminase family protein [Burkholderiales bacterium]
MSGKFNHVAIAKDSPILSADQTDLIDYSKVPQVKNYKQLLEIFAAIRDSRFLVESAYPNFPRRISWLFPGDFCYARTAMAGIYADEQHLVRPDTIFVFGSLNVKTRFSPSGSVSWWYHVSSILGVNDHYFVLDPAINSTAPLPVNQWLKAMNDKCLLARVCSPYTYSPGSGSSCSNATPDDDKPAYNDIQTALSIEIDNVTTLGYVWTDILGNNPPWKPVF